MKKDIILAGVGGQGILSIAAVIGIAAIDDGLYLKQAEVHGMSQRGGDVYSNLRISSEPIASDLIPFGKADMIISVEPMEGLRYLPYLSKDGWLITSTKPFINIPNYPDEQALIDEIKSLPHYIAIDADKIAKEVSTARAANMVMLGAAAHHLGIDYNKIKKAVAQLFGKKGEEVIEVNQKAVQAGYDAAIK